MLDLQVQVETDLENGPLKFAHISSRLVYKSLLVVAAFTIRLCMFLGVLTSFAGLPAGVPTNARFGNCSARFIDARGGPPV